MDRTQVLGFRVWRARGMRGALALDRLLSGSGFRVSFFFFIILELRVE